MNQVFLKFSGLRQDHPFSNTFGATSVAVIEELDPETIAEMPIEELIEFLQKKRKKTVLRSLKRLRNIFRSSRVVLIDWTK